LTLRDNQKRHSNLKVAQKRGVLTCRPLFKNAPAAFLRARFLGAMRIVNADQRSDSPMSLEIAPRKKCLRTRRSKEIITPLPAAASHSDRRQPFSSRLSRDTRVLAKERPETKIIVCEPQDAPLLESGVPQQRNPDGSAAAAHPAFKSHPMQGWTPDFIPKLAADAVGMNVINRIIPIANADALRCSRDLAQKEGIFVGITAGATFAGALRVCAEAPKGVTVLCMLPDTGERYLSTPLFADIPADMSEEETAISRSTPAAQMVA
jgi:hypothetical protein